MTKTQAIMLFGLPGLAFLAVGTMTFRTFHVLYAPFMAMWAVYELVEWLLGLRR